MELGFSRRLGLSSPAKFKHLTLQYGNHVNADGVFYQDTEMVRDLWNVVEALSFFGTRNTNALPVTCTSLFLYGKGTDQNWNTSAVPIGSQLIRNYCFGHPQSTVVLCPYMSPLAYINHG